eukprot:scaffold1472_cov300-Pinguiococcus_pyrenoidosus.AAC.6
MVWWAQSLEACQLVHSDGSDVAFHAVKGHEGCNRLASAIHEFGFAFQSADLLTEALEPSHQPGKAPQLAPLFAHRVVGTDCPDVANAISHSLTLSAEESTVTIQVNHVPTTICDVHVGDTATGEPREVDPELCLGAGLRQTRDANRIGRRRYRLPIEEEGFFLFEGLQPPVRARTLIAIRMQFFPEGWMTYLEAAIKNIPKATSIQTYARARSLLS